MHLKRQEVPKSWPVYRKGTKYIVRPSFNLESSVPLLIVLRDILKLVQNRKEAKRIIFLKQVLLNNKVPKDEKIPVLLFDAISIVSAKKYYRLGLSDKGKFQLNEISEKESERKIAKIVNKKILKGKKVQLNFQDGRNILSNANFKINDSALINFREKKIEKFLPLKENSRAIVFDGKHAGKSGNIKSIDLQKKIAELETGNGEKINVLIKQIMVTE